MKFIRIFLLVLIILGVAALVTHKTWVPKLVDNILEKEKAETLAEIKPVTEGRRCFVYVHAANDTEPYEVTETFDVSFSESTVSGIKNGTQKGPDMTNGYSGIFLGNIKDDILTGTFFYTIEGSSNQEQEIYQVKKDRLEKLRYTLKDEAGVLIPDLTSEPKIITYQLTECSQ